jgi:F0F1-type ATP synthase gamma subunit
LLNKNSRKQLNNLYKLTYTLIQGCLTEDLRQAMLIYPKKWNQIHNHSVVHRIIPLPQSNSATAKHMQVAAILAICADTLSHYIFQPSYLLQTSNDLSDLMADLSETDLLRERYLRSMLLSVLPEKDFKKEIPF